MRIPQLVTAGLLLFIAIVGGCKQSAPPSAVADPQTQIAEALTRLLQRSMETSGCFVIVEDRSTNKFVQFYGSTSDPLMFDVPFVEMTPEEITRAEAFFQNRDGVTKGDLSYMMDFAREVNGAAETAIAVFREVYLIDNDLDLDLKEH
ncbi:MAG: hypothetical protein SYC29_11790 [Planctomycetota bacterium]|nr:hypothetical protein [Planctomycetota bacterium]